MDFNLTQSQIDIQKLAQTFAEREIAPFISQDESSCYFRREVFSKAGSIGLIGITVSEQNGGAGLGTQEYMLALEEIAAVSSGYATSLSVTGLPLSILQNFGTAEQKAKYMPRLLNGQDIGAFALTEAMSGSDAAALKTTARLEGEYYILNGSKQFITNGMEADIFIVMARTGGPGAKGVSAFIVEKKFGITGGKLEKKMGMKVSPTQEILFDNVKVPKANLLANEGDGFKVAMSALDGGRISISAIALGLARSSLAIAVKYAKEREQYGQAIFDFQGISFLLADRATELEGARVLTQKAAWLRDQGLPHTQAAAMAKLASTEACMSLTTDAVQVLGGYGYMEDYVVERYMREAKMLQIVEGTSQIQRRVIARNL
jgi:butyryl-CoA dehydrogenase